MILWFHKLEFSGEKHRLCRGRLRSSARRILFHISGTCRRIRNRVLRGDEGIAPYIAFFDAPAIFSFAGLLREIVLHVVGPPVKASRLPGWGRDGWSECGSLRFPRPSLQKERTRMPSSAFTVSGRLPYTAPGSSRNTTVTALSPEAASATASRLSWLNRHSAS